METLAHKRIHYEDFVLEIGTRNGTGHPVRILRASYPGADGCLHLPFDPAELPDLLRGLERRVRGSGPRGKRNLSNESAGGEAPTAEAIGTALFESLFSGPIRESFLQSHGRVEAHEDRGLRLRLSMDPSDPELATLCALPWELLYRPPEFLSRSIYTPLIRHLNAKVSRLVSAPEPASRLRILVVMSGPADATWLNLEEEKKRIEQEWGRNERVEISFLEDATQKELRQKLASESFHVLHFMGHGDFDPASGRGRLYFENEDKSTDPVAGKVLSEICRLSRSLRLVFINACDSGQLPRWKGQDPYTGVASALVLRGIPAVIAMQFPVSDQAAVAFSSAVYSALASYATVGAAVAAGRLAIYQAFPDSLEWATPVLFVSAIDEDPQVIAPQPEAKEPRRTRKPLRLVLLPAVAIVLVLVIFLGWQALRKPLGPVVDPETPAKDPIKTSNLSVYCADLHLVFETGRRSDKTCPVTRADGILVMDLKARQRIDDWNLNFTAMFLDPTGRTVGVSELDQENFGGEGGWTEGQTGELRIPVPAGAGTAVKVDIQNQ